MCYPPISLVRSWVLGFCLRLFMYLQPRIVLVMVLCLTTGCLGVARDFRERPGYPQWCVIASECGTLNLWLPFIHISLEECLPVVEVVVLGTFIRDHPCIASSHKLGRSTCTGFVRTLMLRRGGGEVVVAACGVFRVAGCPSLPMVA